MFIPAIAGIAGVFPAIFLTPFLAWRKRFLEERVGYVRFRPHRRQWERRNLFLMLLAGIGMFVLGVGVFLYVDEGGLETDWFETMLPGLIAYLLAGLLVGAAVIMGAWRMLAFASVLVAGGVFASVNDTNPGLPLIPAGVVAAVWGSVMLVTFVRAHPKVEQP